MIQKPLIESRIVFYVNVSSWAAVSMFQEDQSNKIIYGGSQRDIVALSLSHMNLYGFFFWVIQARRR